MDAVKHLTRLVVAVGGLAALGALLTFFAVGLSAATVVTSALLALLVAATVRFAIQRTARTETPYW
ncbi:hypothetical protein [Haloprofundus salilacus]|uniref:hypothetical protein n=1 Tax=Haloprofundus salilacus TaxID=2876190 RepID=UPI001CCA4F6F|nr:hypothetical protein [Haloprofundus salilacus]